MTPKNNAVILTEFSPGHLPQIMEIERACFSDPWSENSMTAQLTGKYSLCALASCNGEIAGYVMAVALYEGAEILNVAVSPSHRRQGLGRMMMESILSQCRQKGVERAFLEVRAGNDAAIRLYESFGFKKYGVRKDYYIEPAEDAALMVVEL